MVELKPVQKVSSNVHHFKMSLPRADKTMGHPNTGGTFSKFKLSPKPKTIMSPLTTMPSKNKFQTQGKLPNVTKNLSNIVVSPLSKEIKVAPTNVSNTPNNNPIVVMETPKTVPQSEFFRNNNIQSFNVKPTTFTNTTITTTLQQAPTSNFVSDNNKINVPKVAVNNDTVTFNKNNNDKNNNTADNTVETQKDRAVSNENDTTTNNLNAINLEEQDSSKDKESGEVENAETNSCKPFRVLLHDVHAYITCNLCKGYLIDATTIVECLHSCE